MANERNFKQMRYFTIFIALVGLSCSTTPRQEEQKTTEPVEIVEQPKKSTSELTEPEDPTTFDVKGYELFKAIRDTISYERLSVNILTNSNWRWTALPNCYNYYKFLSDSTGTSISACEIDEENDLTYSIVSDTLLITEFHIPHTDNPEGETLKRREDKYLYTGNSIVMVNSALFNNAGIPREPKIEVIIEYNQLPKN